MIESISTSLNALHKQFEEQVVSDNKKFQIQSIYLPNPTFTINPRTCLVAMEPSLGRMSSEEFQVWVNRGFKNFLLSEGDFILHYCAFHFLCNNSFDYQITDISKGAMTTKLANQQRKDRYSCWMDLLKLELEFLGKPKIIAVGSVTKNFLQDIGWQLQGSILHYSQTIPGDSVIIMSNI